MAASSSTFCTLCSEDDVDNPASHWCAECKSFLCNKCCRSHQRNPASKHHETISVENYKQLPCFIKNTTNHCQTHDKRIEMYCSIHECTCCAECVADKHKTCPDLKKIEEVLSKIKSSAFMSSVKDKLMILYTNSDDILTHLEKEEASVRRQKQRKLIEVQNKRSKVDYHLDRLDQHLSDEIESRSTKLIEKLKASTAKVKSTKDIILKTISGWDAMSNYATDLQTLCGLYAIDSKLKKDSELLKEIHEDEELHESDFEIRYSPMLDSVMTMDNFGYFFISHKKKPPKLKPLEEGHLVIPMAGLSLDLIKPTLLNTYFASERINTFVTGCELLPNGDFMIVDQMVPYIKYYDGKGLMLKPINIKMANLVDICYINDRRCVVSTWDEPKGILFIETHSQNILNNVNVGSGMKHLHFNRVLVVGRNEKYGNEGEIVSLDDDGKILSRFNTNRIGGVYASQNFIYYTECVKNAVVCCNKSGTIKWRFQDPCLKEPSGIAVDGRMHVFVVSAKRNSIVLIYPDGINGKVILAEEDGLNLPSVLCIDGSKRRMLICNKKDGKAFLFQL